MGKNGREFVVSLGNFTHHEVSSLPAFEVKAEIARLLARTALAWRNKSLAKSADGSYKGRLGIRGRSRRGGGGRCVFRLISMAVSRLQKLMIVLLLVYWPALFVLAHMPIPRLVREAGVSDKGLHFLAYLILVFLLTSAISPYKKVSWRRPMVWWVLLVVSGYGVVDELLQKYVGGRTCDATDFLANLAGTLTSLALVSVLDFWTACVVVAGSGIFILTNLTRVNPADLLPITNTVFHLSAYASFTVLWIRYIQLRLKFKTGGGWLATAFAAPLVLLLAAKLGSMVLRRHFGMRDVVLSAAAIAVVVGAVFTVGLLCRKATKTEGLRADDS